MPSTADPRPGASARGFDDVLHLRDGTVVQVRAIDLDRGTAPSGDERAGIAADDLEGRTVGRVTYVRVYGRRAEWTLEVDDTYWHSGLPEALLARLCARAASRGISTFLARVGASHVRLLALLRQEFAARCPSSIQAGGTAVEVGAPLRRGRISARAGSHRRPSGARCGGPPTRRWRPPVGTS